MTEWPTEAMRIANDDDDVPIVVRRLTLDGLLRRRPDLLGEVAGYMEMLCMLNDAHLSIWCETNRWGCEN